ncbi:sigma 54-interacting transcriptional regulator [Gluconobacter oxydans]|uniref:Nitrogen assimilation regulatory protein NtrC n=1 Tax=Gluconobacter oxydans NBRC 3293 TaxID=1315969 RepID=A0A829WYJ7_GLUOY|nr:sigma 54-interacting transcriptional regulator [Gluconobacter oxydans]KXV64380.1 nitrogen assimilation regulator [Gluconobacter oxydans]GEM15747.1 nitrogen assimilation regulatory protein NtrC [Gluconobacter oxydans NBRC 3293]
MAAMTEPSASGLVEQGCHPVFLYGASRLDRQDVARRLHSHSPRAQSPFVIAALTATPRALREAALFGNGEAGWIQQAQGGTLLLDEIDCLCPLMQDRFMDWLAQDETDLRVIAGSRHDPVLLLRQGGLSAALHRWLSALPSAQRLGPERISAVCRLAAGTGTARPRGLERALERPLAEYLEGDLENGAGDLHACVVGEVERPLITMVLRRTCGNQLRAAAILGVNRNTLRKRIRELDITIPKGIDE